MKSKSAEQLKQEFLLAVQELQEVKGYQVLYQKVQEHERINYLIEEQKTVQKELVNAQHVKLTKQVALLEVKLEQIKEELHDIPLYQQFLTSQLEVQDVYEELRRLFEVVTGKEEQVEI